MEIFVIINEQKLKAVLAENSRALALYKELEKGDIIINAKDYGGFEKSGKLPSLLPRNDEQITMQPCDIILYSGFVEFNFFIHAIKRTFYLIKLI